MDLHTQFHAIVDGTNGDTRLDPVNATLGHTHITARGQVVRAFRRETGSLHSIGHDIDLKIEMKQGQDRRLSPSRQSRSGRRFSPAT